MAERPAVAAVAREHLVPAFAREHHLDAALARERGELERRQDRVIGDRIVEGRGDRGQKPPEVVLGEADRLKRGARGGRDRARVIAFVGGACIVEADRECANGRVVQLAHEGQHRG